MKYRLALKIHVSSSVPLNTGSLSFLSNLSLSHGGASLVESVFRLGVMLGEFVGAVGFCLGLLHPPPNWSIPSVPQFRFHVAGPLFSW